MSWRSSLRAASSPTPPPTATGTGRGRRPATERPTRPSSSRSNDPEAGFLGFVTIRAGIEVAEDGQSFAGTYTVELPAAMAEAIGAPVGQLGPGEVTGQRIAVEPMGEPVGPLPEEPVEPPAPDEAPAAPEASPMAPEESPAA